MRKEHGYKRIETNLEQWSCCNCCCSNHCCSNPGATIKNILRGILAESRFTVS